MVLFWGITLGVFCLSYEDVYLGLISIGEIERVEEFKSQFFTLSTFNLLRWGLISFTVTLVLFHKSCSKSLGYLGVYFDWVYCKVKESWVHFTSVQKNTLLIALFFLSLIRVLFLLFWEYYEDEQFSYQYLVSKGFLTTLTYYPGPNNHVFNNLLACVFDLVFTEKWAMRLPSILVSGITFYLMIVMLMKKKSFEFSIVAALLLQISFNYFLYSFQGRGYALELLFVILSFYAWWRYEYTRDNKYKMLFVISSVLGFYTIPVFLFPAVSIVLFFIHGPFKKQLCKSVFVIGGLITLCYMPIFLVSGWTMLVGNDWVKPQLITQLVLGLPEYLLGLQDWLWDFPNYGIWLSVILVLYMIYQYKRESWFIPLLIAFISPIVLMIILRVHPFPRVWTYMVISQVLIMTEVFFSLKSLTFRYFLIALYFFMQCYSFYVLL